MWSPKRTRDYATMPIADRLAKRSLALPSGCVEWQGGLNNKGYGMIVAGSRVDGSRRFRLAHRVSYEVARGVSLQNDDLVLHRCDNPKCINPEHLFVGTQKDNISDCISKGRFFSIGKATRKLTEDAVREIKRRPNEDSTRLGCEFGVSRGVINHIRRGSAWRGVQP